MLFVRQQDRQGGGGEGGWAVLRLPTTVPPRTRLPGVASSSCRRTTATPDFLTIWQLFLSRVAPAAQSGGVAVSWVNAENAARRDESSRFANTIKLHPFWAAHGVLGLGYRCWTCLHLSSLALAKLHAHTVLPDRTHLPGHLCADPTCAGWPGGLAAQSCMLCACLSAEQVPRLHKPAGRPGFSLLAVSLAPWLMRGVLLHLAPQAAQLRQRHFAPWRPFH